MERLVKVAQTLWSARAGQVAWSVKVAQAMWSARAAQTTWSIKVTRAISSVVASQKVTDLSHQAARAKRSISRLKEARYKKLKMRNE